MAISNGRTARETALEYLCERGWSVLPVPFKKKKPIVKRWQKLRLSAEGIEKHFHAESNIGVLLGEPSRWLVDVDLDHEDTLELRDKFLPPTGCIFGRAGKPQSHCLYYVSSPVETKQIKSAELGMVIELRSTGGQTVFPGSVHPSGEPIEWHEFGEPARVDPKQLVDAVTAIGDEVLRRHGVTKSTATTSARATAPLTDVAERAARYIAKIPPAISGQGGHNQTFHVACVLVMGFGLSPEQAMPIIAVWNQTCKPPWSEKDLKKKLGDANKQSGERGDLLRGTTQKPKRGKTKTQDGDSQTDSREVPSNEHLKNHGVVATLAEHICGDNHFAVDHGGRLYRLSDGVYKTRAEQFVAFHAKRLLTEWNAKQKWNRNVGGDVALYIGTDAPELWEKPPADIINVKNGLLNVITRELLPHSPKHLSPIQLPVKYERDQTCHDIDDFVCETFPSDAFEVAFEIAAWLMTPDTSIQKAVLLTGSGGNGKSVFLRLLSAFIGSQNISAVTLHQLEANRFASARLVGKLANVCADLPSNHLAGTSVFKQVTGGDIMPAEHKFKDSFEFTPYARLVFSANHPPRSDDSSEAFFDRWFVIPFDRSFRGTDREIPSVKLDAKLQAPNQLSGMLNRCLDALGTIRQCHRLTEPESCREAWREFHATTDPLSVWLDENTVDDPNMVTPCDQLIQAYGEHCDKKGQPRLTKTAIGRALAKLRPSVESKKRTTIRGVRWCYLGIGMLSEDHVE